MRSLLPMAERLGVTTGTEVEIETFAERLYREAIAHGAMIIPPLLVAAWARV